MLIWDALLSIDLERFDQWVDDASVHHHIVLKSIVFYRI